MDVFELEIDHADGDEESGELEKMKADPGQDKLL